MTKAVLLGLMAVFPSMIYGMGGMWLGSVEHDYTETLYIRSNSEHLVAQRFRIKPSGGKLYRLMAFPAAIQSGQWHWGSSRAFDLLLQAGAPSLHITRDADPCARESEEVQRREQVQIPASLLAARYMVHSLSSERSLLGWLDEHGLSITAEQIAFLRTIKAVSFLVVEISTLSRPGSPVLTRPFQVAWKGEAALSIWPESPQGRLYLVQNTQALIPESMSIPAAVRLPQESVGRWNSLYAMIRPPAGKTFSLESSWQGRTCSGCLSMTADVWKELGLWWDFRKAAITRLRYRSGLQPGEVKLISAPFKRSYEMQFGAHEIFAGAKCEAAGTYYDYQKEQEQKAWQVLTTLTGKDRQELEKAMGLQKEERPFWKKLWE
jgi:hypothetical protein